MGPHKLSGKVKITLPEAEQLINKYFATFPKIGAVLKYLQNFGIKEGYSRTLPPFFRKRWYPYWEFNKRFINDHISGRDYNATLGEIGRASGNHPIQGACADITKQALVTIYNYIRDEGLTERIYLVAQVHDQVTTICDDELKDWWRDKMDELMCEAAKVVIPTGILKADTQVSSFWTK